jgi:hypothetical protein
MSRDLARAALHLAANCGYRVLPVTPGSKRPPLQRGWAQTATTDPERVAELWRKHPEANPAVAAGKGLLVVDADTDDAISRLRELGVPEGTPTVATPRGGRHFYLRGQGATKTSLLPGVDIRGSRGYALGAGARSGDGTYEWMIPPWEVDEAAIPAELERLIRALRPKERSTPEIVGVGGRNNYLTRVGGAMRRAGLSADAIGAGLHSENIARCRPPLLEREVDRIVKSCSTMSGAAPWVLDPWPLIRDERLSTSARFVLDALCRCASDDGTVRGGEWISIWTGLSRRSITTAVAELEKAGLLAVKREQRKPNIYTIVAVHLSPLHRRGTTTW